MSSVCVCVCLHTQCVINIVDYDGCSRQCTVTSAAAYEDAYTAGYETKTLGTL